MTSAISRYVPTPDQLADARVRLPELGRLELRRILIKQNLQAALASATRFEDVRPIIEALIAVMRL